MLDSAKCHIRRNVVKQEADMREKESCMWYLQNSFHGHFQLLWINTNVNKYDFWAHIIHPPRRECIWGTQYREKIVGPEVISNVTKENDPETSLEEKKFLITARCKMKQLIVDINWYVPEANNKKSTYGKKKLAHSFAC